MISMGKIDKFELLTVMRHFWNLVISLIEARYQILKKNRVLPYIKTSTK